MSETNTMLVQNDKHSIVPENEALNPGSTVNIPSHNVNIPHINIVMKTPTTSIPQNLGSFSNLVETVTEGDDRLDLGNLQPQIPLHGIEISPTNNENDPAKYQSESMVVRGWDIDNPDAYASSCEDTKHDDNDNDNEQIRTANTLSVNFGNTHTYNYSNSNLIGSGDVFQIASSGSTQIPSSGALLLSGDTSSSNANIVTDNHDHDVGNIAIARNRGSVGNMNSNINHNYNLNRSARFSKSNLSRDGDSINNSRMETVSENNYNYKHGNDEDGYSNNVFGVISNSNVKMKAKRQIAREYAPRADVNLNNKCVLCLSHLGKDYCVALKTTSFVYHKKCIDDYIRSLIGQKKTRFKIPETNEIIGKVRLIDVYQFFEPVGYINMETDKKPIWKRFAADDVMIKTANINNNNRNSGANNQVFTSLSPLTMSSAEIVIDFETNDERIKAKEKQIEQQDKAEKLRLIQKNIVKNMVMTNENVAAAIVAPSPRGGVRMANIISKQTDAQSGNGVLSGDNNASRLARESGNTNTALNPTNAKQCCNCVIL